ncbi:acetyltransferase [Xylariales sp. AK1849]|nr:acetyltransferase [Xylariales sp. AK1849]
MGTPFISLLEPTKLDGYDRSKPHDQQVASIPSVFCEAMEVREAVFVKEQGWSLEDEHDSDDARSCHWVAYASVNRVIDHEQVDHSTGQVVRPRRSETRTQPIGTLRIVPFPHPAHPQDGGRYAANMVPQSEDLGSQGGADLTASQEARESAPMPYGPDRATTFHDGREPYVTLGRVAVISEFRGHKISGQLWRAARAWLEVNPGYFDPSVKELGMEALKAERVTDIPLWKGLVCCHAQDRPEIIRVYERWGFRVDEGMGKWWEEDVPHVGMFLRLDVKDTPPMIS